MTPQLSAYELLLAAPPVPAHPTTQVPFMAEMLFTVFLGIPVVVGVFFAIKHLVTGRGPLLAFCLIGVGLRASSNRSSTPLGSATSGRARR